MANKQFINLPSWRVVVAWGLIGVGIFAIAYFMFKAPFNDGSDNRCAELFGWFGDFIGGFVGSLFALSGFILLYETLILQHKTINTQRDELMFQHQAIAQERFENTFFNLLQMQQKIVENINTTFYYLDSNQQEQCVKYTGRDAFPAALTELKRIDASIKSLKYNEYYNKDNRDWEDELAYIAESMQPEYSGDNKAEKAILKVKERLNLQYVNLIYEISNGRWSTANKRPVKSQIQIIYYLFFNKYHFVVGHYFRHLYHILKYIRLYETRCIDMAQNSIEKKHIKENCKEYARLVQAQMSTYELALLYYNSLCYPKMQELVKYFDLLDNLTIFDLVRTDHYLKNEGITLKTTRMGATSMQ